MTFHSGADAFELEAHLGGAAALGGKDVGGNSVHFDVGGGGGHVLIFSDLQELIAKLDAVVQAEEGDHLVVKARIILHIVGVENGEHAVDVVSFQAALKVGQNVADDFVGKIEGLSGRSGLRCVLSRGRCCWGREIGRTD